MNRTLLYYPTINIPRRSWLIHAVLYWDKVSSIVPTRWDDKVMINLNPEIRGLIDEGLFIPKKPDALFEKCGWDEVEKFGNELEEIVSDPHYMKFISGGKGKIDPQTFRFSRIHRDKVSMEFREILKSKNLLIELPEDGEWLRVEHKTSLLYMSLLAKYLADIDADHTTISTDEAAYEKFNFRRVTPDKGFPVVSMDFSNILPTPKENVPLEKLVKFKKKRGDNLLHFRKILSDMEKAIGQCTSQAEYKETVMNFHDDLKIGVNDLVDVLGDSKIDITLKALQSLMQLKTPALLGAIGTATGMISLPLGLGIAGGLQLTGGYVEMRNKKRAELRKSPFAYIYHARRSGIIKK